MLFPQMWWVLALLGCTETMWTWADKRTYIPTHPEISVRTLLPLPSFKQQIHAAGMDSRKREWWKEAKDALDKIVDTGNNDNDGVCVGKGGGVENTTVEWDRSWKRVFGVLCQLKLTALRLTASDKTHGVACSCINHTDDEPYTWQCVDRTTTRGKFQ